MTTIQEITSILPRLSTEELQSIEHAIHALYRNRNENIIYDDVYGIWTDQDQNLASAEVFKLLDMEKELNDNAKSYTFCIPENKLKKA